MAKLAAAARAKNVFLIGDTLPTQRRLLQPSIEYGSGIATAGAGFSIGGQGTADQCEPAHIIPHVTVTLDIMRVRTITVAAAAPAHDRAINTGPRDQRGCQWEPNMTASFTSTLRQAGLVLAFAVSLSTLSATESFAFSAEAQAMCTGDAFRLCSADIPNIPKITACMFKHRAQLSVGCRNVMNRDLARKGKRVAEAE